MQYLLHSIQESMFFRASIINMVCRVKGISGNGILKNAPAAISAANKAHKHMERTEKSFIYIPPKIDLTKVL